jgi:hypothetical protein
MLKFQLHEHKAFKFSTHHINVSIHITCMSLPCICCGLWMLNMIRGMEPGPRMLYNLPSIHYKCMKSHGGQESGQRTIWNIYVTFELWMGGPLDVVSSDCSVVEHVTCHGAVVLNGMDPTTLLFPLVWIHK